jgi:hypothetical protein
MVECSGGDLEGVDEVVGGRGGVVLGGVVVRIKDDRRWGVRGERKNPVSILMGENELYLQIISEIN